MFCVSTFSRSLCHPLIHTVHIDWYGVPVFSKMVFQLEMLLTLVVLVSIAFSLPPSVKLSPDGNPIIDRNSVSKDRRHRSFNAVTIQYSSLHKRNTVHRIKTRLKVLEYAGLAYIECPPPDFMWEKTHSHGDPFGSTEDERRGETYFKHLVDPSLTQFYEPAGGYSTKTQRDAQPNATTIWLEYKDSSIVNSVSFNRALEKISHAPFSTLYWNAEKQLTSFHPPCEGKRTKLRWLKDSSPTSFEQILSSPPTGSAGPPDSILESSSPNTERDVATALPVLPARTWRVHNGYISKIMESSMNDSVLTSLDGLSSIKAILADGEWRPHEVLTID